MYESLNDCYACILTRESSFNCQSFTANNLWISKVLNVNKFNMEINRLNRTIIKIDSTMWYCTVKNFGGKKVWWKGCCKGLAKKLWQMLTCIADRPSSINSKTKLNESIPNINEHNKMNSLFFRICLGATC